MRRVNIQKCRVRFGADVPPSQRVASASESLKDSAEVRVTAEQDNEGEWMASEIVILKLPEIVRARLRIYGPDSPAGSACTLSPRLATGRTLDVEASGSVLRNLSDFLPKLSFRKGV